MNKLMADHYQAGRSVAWIAGELSMSEDAVYKALQRLGVKRPLQASSKRPRPREIEGGLAAFLKTVSGRESVSQGTMTSSVTEELARTYLASPSAFLRDFAPLRLLSYQEGMLDAIHAHPRVLLLCSRQVGKSTISSYYATWFAYTHPGAVVLLVANVQRQADIDLEYVRGLIMANPLLRASLAELSQTAVRLVTDARIYSLPAGDTGDTIRGFSADVVIVDESARCPEQLWNVVLPMIATKRDPKLILCTTPRAMTGFTWNAFRSPDVWHTVRITARESPLLTEEYLKTMARAMPTDAFKMEFEAEFVDESVSAFPFALLDQCEDPDIEVDLT